jgi:sulfur-oxidizing protein SoxB
VQRRDFLQALVVSIAGGASLRPGGSEAQSAAQLYDVAPFGNVSLLHITDVHAQLLPVYFREPSVNLGNGEPPHLVGAHFLKRFGIRPGSEQAYAFTHVEFEKLAPRYGKLGGYAHLATLVKRLRASRPGALLLDGGDSWQGSASALWTRGSASAWIS